MKYVAGTAIIQLTEQEATVMGNWSARLLSEFGAKYCPKSDPDYEDHLILSAINNRIKGGGVMITDKQWDFFVELNQHRPHYVKQHFTWQ